jgi:hypothetical protein
MNFYERYCFGLQHSCTELYAYILKKYKINFANIDDYTIAFCRTIVNEKLSMADARDLLRFLKNKHLAQYSLESPYKYPFKELKTPVKRRGAIFDKFSFKHDYAMP